MNVYQNAQGRFWNLWKTDIQFLRFQFLAFLGKSEQLKLQMLISHWKLSPNQFSNFHVLEEISNTFGFRSHMAQAEQPTQ